MVTRNIEANKPTQINSDKVGVLVKGSEINCTVSYSVDGNTWTDWPEKITDDNNVISNIPRYMYLKFSQDVVITEE